MACLSGQIVFPQLHSHILGALNVGAQLEEIRSIFDQTEYVWGKEEQAMVDGYWIDFALSYNYHKIKKATPSAPKSEKEKKVPTSLRLATCPARLIALCVLLGVRSVPER